MYLLRFTALILILGALNFGTTINLSAQESTEDPFKEQSSEAVKEASELGEPIQEFVPQEKIEDPFGGSNLVQESEDSNPFNIQNTESETETKQEDENPFVIPETTQEPAKESTPFGEVAAEQDSENPFGEQSIMEQPENQTGGSDESQDSGAQDVTFEAQFWEYLKSNAYENWAPVAGTSGDFYVGESPHGAFLKMYMNRTAAGNPDSLPNGSIIVKENYGIDRSTLMAITVMYRSKGYAPNDGDWYWAKFNPDGSVAATSAEMGANPIAGRVQSCIDCHDGAEGDDFAFFNDKK